MSKHTSKYKSNRYYRTETFGKSVFDDKPTLILNHYRVPNTYKNAVSDVLEAYRLNGIPFNRAVDQVYALNPTNLNRNKLAEHTLKTIANDF